MRRAEWAIGADFKDSCGYRPIRLALKGCPGLQAPLDAILAIYSALAKNVSAASWSNVLKVPHWQMRSSILQYPGSQYRE
jgi:hypothetical protein